MKDDSKKITKKDREDLKRLTKIGLVAPDKPGKRKQTFSVRIAPERNFKGETYPGFDDHPSELGIEYSKHIDTAETASVWEALANEYYAMGGIPVWIKEAISILDTAVYWQLVHYQFFNDGKAYPSLKTLSRNLWVRRNSVRASLARLVEVGLIVRVRQASGRRPAQYQVIQGNAIPEKVLPPRRADSGFAKLSNPVEDIAQNLEDIAQTDRGHRAISQKTKPPLGVEAASAERSRVRSHTSTKAQSQTISSPMTIDAEKKKRRKELDREKHRVTPTLIRPFYEHEVTIEILTEIINKSDSLSQKYETILDLEKRLGKFNPETGVIEPGRWSEKGNPLLHFFIKDLRARPRDVSKLPNVLNKLLTLELERVKENAEIQERAFKNHAFREKQRREAEEARLLREREKKEAEMKVWEQARLNLISKLSELRDRFLAAMSVQYTPEQIEGLMEGFGVAQEISHYSGRISGIDEIERELVKALAFYSEKFAPVKLDPNELLERWYYQKLVFPSQ